ncbi:hypothetical protein [Streptomyces sp. NPDC002994]|uniref:hypothetical protein n=1 Tax=Streptomyces sp. NPDC002994 TaxID=3154441 RepID=UPI0033B0CC23
MTEPRLIPPPPNYPPSAGAYKPAPEPRVIVVTPEVTKDDKPSLLASLRPVYNLTATATALAPVFGGYSLASAVGLALHDCRTQQSTAGAWVIAGCALGITLYLDRTRPGWTSRVLLITAGLGTLLALPWLEALLYLMTGVRT